jgi:glycosyltransferase involved in cell wall biosynthesis
MRVGLRLFYNEAWMGGVNYVLNIARMLRNLPEGERPEIVFLTAAPQAEAIAQKHAYLADEIAHFSAARSLNLDFVYPATQVSEAPFGAPWGGWIPDWQCRHYPELFAADERIRRFLQYRTLAEHPAVCVFSSRQAIEDTRALFGQPANTAYHVFHFPAVLDEGDYSRSAEQLAATRAKFGVPERYLVVCNQFWKHKNHLVIAEALALAPETDITIVMTGAMEDERWPDYAQKVRETLARPEVARRVILTGRIDRSEQVDLILGASGILQPSLFEGWSTFVEEARATGLPGLISDIPVHREQSPPGCSFFDATDPASLARALAQFVAAPPARPTLAEAKARHQDYIAGCARTFMIIARDCAERYDPARHETTAILASVLPRLKSEIGDTSLAEPFEQADYDRFLAAVRIALRASPEDLARLAGRLCTEDNPYADDALKLLVLATLAKCEPQDRRRFLDFDPAAGADAREASAISAAQSKARASAPGEPRFIEHAFVRARDFVRRKLPG